MSLLFRKKRSCKKSVKIEVDSLPDDVKSWASTESCNKSLGTGTFPVSGRVTFMPSPLRCGDSTSTSITSLDACAQNDSSATRSNTLLKLLSDGKLAETLKVAPVVFKRVASSFIRVADLNMAIRSTAHGSKSVQHPNFHHPSADPPPGMLHDPNEEWIALDDGAGSHAPIAPYAIQALARFGFDTCMDINMWKDDSRTEKLMKSTNIWSTLAWQLKGPIVLPDNFAADKDVLVWSGNFMHGKYGSDLPCVRAAGIVNMGAKDLADLLADSTRTHEYNKMSCGRKDLLVLQDNMQVEGPFGKSITKVMQSESRPPFLRKTLQFTSILHVKELEDGSGYLLVSRAVTHPGSFSLVDASILRSEILMGVNVLKKVVGAEDSQCLMINVNHMRAPMVPMMIAKKIGLAAAANFFTDIRALC
jgi:hypothetical protein